MRNTVRMGQAPLQVPVGVVVLVVLVGGRVVVVLVLVVEVVVGPGVVLVVARLIVVLVVVVVLAAEVATVGWKVASTITQLVAVARVRLPSCGPSALDRMSSRSAAALPFCTSRTYGTIWLLPGVALPGWPPVRTAATTSSPAGTEAVGPTLAYVPAPAATMAWSSASAVATPL